MFKRLVGGSAKRLKLESEGRLRKNLRVLVTEVKISDVKEDSYEGLVAETFICGDCLLRGMGQNEVYQFLKSNRGRWFASGEIQKALSVSSSSISISLMKLKKHKQVFFKQNPKRRNTYLYMVR